MALRFSLHGKPCIFCTAGPDFVAVVANGALSSLTCAESAVHPGVDMWRLKNAPLKQSSVHVVGAATPPGPTCSTTTQVLCQLEPSNS